MLKSILQAGFRKGLYGCAAALAVFLQTVTSATVPTDQIGQLVWQVAVIPAVTAAAGAIARWVSFKPELAGK